MTLFIVHNHDKNFAAAKTLVFIIPSQTSIAAGNSSISEFNLRTDKARF